MKIIKKVKRSDQRHSSEMLHDIEKIISYFVKESYLKKWEKEAVLRKILINLIRLFNQKTISLQNSSMKSALTLYTLKPTLEPIISDFAIILDINFHDGYETEGVVFFKTLLRDNDKNTFSDLKKDKLKKIISVSPFSSLILFDYDIIAGMALPPANHSDKVFTETAYATNCVVVPGNLAMNLGQKNTGLYKISTPFSHELLNRYSFGLNLDYSSSALDVAKGFKTDKGYVQNLLHIAIGQGGADLKKDVNYNWEVYSPYDQPQYES